MKRRTKGTISKANVVVVFGRHRVSDLNGSLVTMNIETDEFTFPEVSLS